MWRIPRGIALCNENPLQFFAVFFANVFIFFMVTNSSTYVGLMFLHKNIYIVVSALGKGHKIYLIMWEGSSLTSRCSSFCVSFILTGQYKHSLIITDIMKACGFKG